MKVRKAIIPAAGLGTRFLPATKAIAKEMLPIVDIPTLNGAWKLDGSVLLEILRHPHEYGQHFDFGKIENKEENDYRVRLDKDLWFLDGSQNLNGKRILDAERREEELT